MRAWEPCEELRLLGRRLLEVSRRVNCVSDYNDLNFIQWQITEHRRSCPICVASARRRQFVCVERGKGDSARP